MQERLNEAMEYVERTLGDPGEPGCPVDMAELARIAVTSEYHFRRMFSALAGMPLSEYIRRRRLTVAGAEVLDDRRTLLEIAVRYGYSSGEAFARAFRAQHGVGPGEARRRGATLRSQPRMSFRLIVEGSASMRYRVVEKPEFRLVGHTTRVPLVHEGMNPAIVEFLRGIGWAELDRLAELSDQEPDGVVSASINVDESRAEGTELDYWHGVVRGGPVPEGLAALDVAAGTWAVFESEGSFPETLQYLWRDVFTQWFPSNPYRSRPGPELVRADVSEDRSEATAQLWIPVERAAQG
ncbi:AraC family transcriptional regulator [Streptomyces sp. NPDC002851]